jgi:hypothetical protein
MSYAAFYRLPGFIHLPASGPAIPGFPWKGTIYKKLMSIAFFVWPYTCGPENRI